MHRKLIAKAFEKAKVEMEKSGISNPTTTKLAKYLTDRIDEEVNFVYGDRSLRNYYNRILDEVDGEINIPQIEVINGLCKYLGYLNYKDFILKEESMSDLVQVTKEDSIDKGHIVTRKEQVFIFRNNKIILFGVGIVLILILFASGIMSDDQKWMVWEGDRYIESQFDEVSYSEGSLKLLDEKIMSNFREIDPNCSTDFFKSNGKVTIWYGKNRGREYEFFTSFGSHPETGDPLKPITEYMIGKYICDSLK